MNNIYYIESYLDMPEEVPLCPVCDQPIMEHEKIAIGLAYGAKCLVHMDCVQED